MQLFVSKPLILFQLVYCIDVIGHDMLYCMTATESTMTYVIQQMRYPFLVNNNGCSYRIIADMMVKQKDLSVKL